MDFSDVIKEQRKELEDKERKERIIKRSLLDKAKRFLKYPNILVITGVRRCGKSIFSYLIAKESSFGYVNFDDERLFGLKTENLNDLLQAIYELYGDVNYIILDEVQNVERWELFATRLRGTKKVILTGSNSKLLSGELATHLTGRHIDLTLHPLSFTEFLDLNEFKISKVYTTQEKAEILRLLKEYLKIGGFPEVHKFGKEILSGIYNDIISKDILLRYKIRKKDEIRKLSKYLITNSGGETSYTKLANILNIKHVSTLSNWISYLEDSFLILRLERFSFKLKQQLLAPKKFYCVDPGIVNTIGFNFSENIGNFMENIVALELQRKKSEDPSIEIYYWKDYYHGEVDFVIKRGAKVKQIVQVTYANSKEEIKEREISGLLKCSRELKCSNLIILTWNLEGEEKIKNKKIKYIPLWKWLLEE